MDQGQEEGTARERGMIIEQGTVEVHWEDTWHWWEVFWEKEQVE